MKKFERGKETGTVQYIAIILQYCRVFEYKVQYGTVWYKCSTKYNVLSTKDRITDKTGHCTATVYQVLY